MCEFWPISELHTGQALFLHVDDLPVHREFAEKKGSAILQPQIKICSTIYFGLNVVLVSVFLFFFWYGNGFVWNIQYQS